MTFKTVHSRAERSKLTKSSLLITASPTFSLLEPALTQIGVEATEKHGAGTSISCSKYAVPEPRYNPDNILLLGPRGFLWERNLGHGTKHTKRPSISRFGMQSILPTSYIPLVEEVRLDHPHLEAYFLIFH